MMSVQPVNHRDIHVRSNSLEHEPKYKLKFYTTKMMTYTIASIAAVQVSTKFQTGRLSVC